MNDIISIQSIQSYQILLTIYEKILFNLKCYLNEHKGRDGGGGEGEGDSHQQEQQSGQQEQHLEPTPLPSTSLPSSSHHQYPSLSITEDDYYLSNILNYDFHTIATTLSSVLYFLCSICNDIHKILSSHFYLLSSHIPPPHPSNEYRNCITQIERKFSYILMITLETMTHIIFHDIQSLFHQTYEQVWLDQQDTSSSPVVASLSHLSSYLNDFLKLLHQDSYDQLVILCCRKLIKLYFLMLSSHSQEIQSHNALHTAKNRSYNTQRGIGGSGNGVLARSTSMTLSILQRIPSFNPFGNSSAVPSSSAASVSSPAEDERLKFSYFHFEQIREDVERIATFCMRQSYSKTTNLLQENEELSSQFNLMNVCPSPAPSLPSSAAAPAPVSHQNCPCRHSLMCWNWII
jgi:hypothetical protein